MNKVFIVTQCTEDDLKELLIHFRGSEKQDLIWLLNNNPPFSELFKKNESLWRYEAILTCSAFSVFQNKIHDKQTEIDPKEYIRTVEYRIGEDDSWRQFTSKTTNLKPAPEGLQNTFGGLLNTNKLKKSLAKNALSVNPVTTSQIAQWKEVL